MSIIVTGAAGFIGFHLSKRLLSLGYQVIGIDNLNEYYDVALKKERLSLLETTGNFTFYKIDLANQDEVLSVYKNHSIDIVIHLAAQAGVRYSLTHPHSYVHSNLQGFLNILEACRQFPVEHMIYASSSSVYGANAKTPFSEKDPVDHPVSLYAASKKANELMAHTYSHLYDIPTTGLRFFTVYGPWGRPDMAYYSFTRDIIEGNPIKVFNHGDMSRDFTFIDDIVEGIVKLLHQPPKQQDGWNREKPDPSSSYAPFKLYNIGNNNPVKLLDFIQILEEKIGKKAKMVFLPMQPGDVKITYADITDLQKDVGFSPSTALEKGLESFVNWYKDYHQKK
ncbi:NAD-dependent epimerase [Mesobacillus selenatarsenatis]|uniref:UDP-glucose 4-epimerase n=1 Tax=Mesobacillus selenatarsenatis (strain DSM 18680 / JCM 14380 / FERM P-15431 / SF-1) TaxID=1321606 RepID=A0A0A8X6E0_MESS1|nr:NAD-dependent epimerase [Mesobacillus selenatarsenatis]GAM15535.1 UDP-glucose 4-epimerase [Mesobacillus selenatarsenatis SF-1]